MIIHLESWFFGVAVERPPYSRELGAFPSEAVKAGKYWPAVNRVDNVHGDRHLICTCPSIDSYRE
ncbi:hypothetical protein ACFQH5_11020 [Halomonas salifodinae]|uniref:Glycine dehydrogenase (aminomethyl-transferring) n=1 Tax=Halomonas salifodinae TaxID=438745 RepID=A0ABW2EZ14_9GAMM